MTKEKVIDINTVHVDILLTTEEIEGAIEKVRKSRDRFIDDKIIRGIVLPEEVDKIKFELRSQKAAIRNQKKYLEKLNNPVQFRKLKSTYLYRNFIKSGFIIDQWNRKIVKNLCRYFAGEQSSEYSLNKGVLLFGGFGVGKTAILTFFRRNSHNPFIIKSCRDITFEYESDGAEAILKYSNLIKTGDPGYYYGNANLGLCLEDIGTEDDKKNFGNLSNVIANVILSRYDKLYDYEKNPVLVNKTHGTTNLSRSEFLERYGSRAESRIAEMFNIFKFDAKSPDRRKTK